MTKYKTKFTRDVMTGLRDTIAGIITTTPEDDVDRLLWAAMAQVYILLEQRLALETKKVYRITFTPVQAMALRLLYTEWLRINPGHLGTAIMNDAMEIDRILTKPSLRGPNGTNTRI